MIEETRRYETTDGSCVLPIAAHVVSARKRDCFARFGNLREQTSRTAENP